jgi:serine/threonine protein kinase
MPAVGQSVGHYRLVGFIGHGGMGDVYDGYDELLKRRVALKSIRREFRLLPEAKQRFLREAQTLSKLEHPHICRIYDLVEDPSGDYLVLEFIEGRGLRQAMASGASRTELLSIAEQIADVLVAAHDKGVVHRDLKPENVMVTEDGQAKVLDFGLSRLVVEEPAPEVPDRGQPSPIAPPAARSDETMTTGPLAAAPPDRSEETRTVTPPIASGPGAPRRRSHRAASAVSTVPLSRVGSIMGTPGYMSPEQARGEPVTPASDMYAFGLLLQEMFTGRRAVDVQHSDTERLAMAARGESRPVEGLDQDLTTLIQRLKSLEPNLRPTAIETRAVFLDIEARPVRRRKRILVAAAFVVLALFSAATAVQALRISREKARADREAESARKALEFVSSMFGEVDPDRSRGATLTAKEILDHGREKLDELEGQPLLQANVARTLGDLYGKLGIYDPARVLLEKADATFEREPGARDPLTARNLHGLASIYRYQGRLAEAETLLRRAVSTLERALGPEHADVASCYHTLAVVNLEEGKLDEAVRLGQHALEIREKSLATDPARVAQSLNALAVIYVNQQRFAEAEPLYRRILEIQQRTLGPDHRGVAETLNNFALFYYHQGKYRDALPLAQRAVAIDEKVLGPEHPTLATNLGNLAMIQMALEKDAEAERLYRRALDIRTKALGPNHRDVAICYLHLAILANNQGKDPQAEALFTRALDLLEKSLGPEHPTLGSALTDAAEFYRERGKYGTAVRMLERACAIDESAFGPTHSRVLGDLKSLALIDVERGDSAAALGRMRKAVDRGLDDPGFLEAAEFSKLQGTPEFQRLGAEVKSRADAKRSAAPAPQ